MEFISIHSLITLHILRFSFTSLFLEIDLDFFRFFAHLKNGTKELYSLFIAGGRRRTTLRMLDISAKFEREKAIVLLCHRERAFCLKLFWPGRTLFDLSCFSPEQRLFLRFPLHREKF